MSEHADINNPGEPNSIQRLIYESARCQLPSDYCRLSALADRVLEDMGKRGELDTVTSLLVNGLAAMVAQVVDLQSGITKQDLADMRAGYKGEPKMVRVPV